jgi:type II secretory pathway pseudopilin PulG
MAVLIVGLSIMAVMLTVAMPVWRQMVQREKEEELVFRGTQYARAIGLFGRKYANANPPSIDVLVQQRFLRKKYKDPITRDDFLPLLAGQAVPGATPAAGGPAGSQGRGGAAATQPASGTAGNAQPGQPATSTIGTPGAGGTGGIIGVVSKSKDKSIRIYNGRTHYNEWVFVYTPPAQAPGAGAPGTAVPGQRGQPGQPGGAGVGGGRGRGNPNGPGGAGRGGPGTPGPRFGNPFGNPSGSGR